MKTLTITMNAFFALPEVKDAQEVQKRHPYGSDEHLNAFEKIKLLAATYNVAQYLGDY